MLCPNKYLQIMIIYLRTRTAEAISRPDHTQMLFVPRRVGHTGAVDALRAT